MRSWCLSVRAASSHHAHVAQTKIQAIFLGTREGDPHSDRIEAFSPTDEDWPAFMRVHPVLHWSYAQVWAYLEAKPYCSLYDQVRAPGCAHGSVLGGVWPRECLVVVGDCACGCSAHTLTAGCRATRRWARPQTRSETTCSSMMTSSTGATSIPLSVCLSLSLSLSR